MDKYAITSKPEQISMNMPVSKYVCANFQNGKNNNDPYTCTKNLRTMRTNSQREKIKSHMYTIVHMGFNRGETILSLKMRDKKVLTLNLFLEIQNTNLRN